MTPAFLAIIFVVGVANGSLLAWLTFRHRWGYLRGFFYQALTALCLGVIVYQLSQWLGII